MHGGSAGPLSVFRPLPFDSVAGFCRRFATFLESDGRHHLWISSPEAGGTLVYDQHEWIWAYGDLPTYLDVLADLGLREGEIELPFPHAHQYHPENDADARALMEYWEWIHSPLRPGDEYRRVYRE